MPGLIEPNQVGQKQDLSAYITNVERADFPLMTMIPKDTTSKTTFETQVDDYGDTNDITGVNSAADVDSYADMAENRGIIENSVMKMRESWKVDSFIDVTSSNPAVASERLEQIRKAIVRLKMRVEKKLFSRTEAAKQGQNGATAYDTCSVGGFLNSSAPTGTQVVPERFRTPAAHLYTSTVAAITETTANTIMQEIYEATHGQGMFTFFQGSELKEKYSSFSLWTPNVSSNTLVRQINNENNGELKQIVDVIKGDFGVAALIPSTRINHFDSAGAATSSAIRRGSGFIMDLKMWGLAFKQRFEHMDLPDGDGGPRGVVRAIFGLRCKNPKAQGAYYVSG